MACPFFYPTEPVVGQHLVEQRWRTDRPMPLGDPFQGECRAKAVPYHPKAEELKNLCNLGYVRGKCPRFPQGCQVDAARFALSRDTPDRVAITYVQERDYRPFSHGTLEYLTARQGWATPPADRNLRRQALAYLGAYRRRKASVVSG